MNRVTDLILAGLLALPALGVVGIACILVRLETPGAPLFVQTRVGRHGRHFKMIKLRTMHIGTGDHASHEVGQERITRVGAILRRFKIDELPQIWSVLRGDMSFVGPRPCLPGQTDLVAARKQLGVLEKRPGITGLAQVNGVDMSDPLVLARLDADYVTNASSRMNLLIILSTISGRGFGDATDPQARRR